MEAGARSVSAARWTTPFLIGLLDDPYDAVRFVAYRSLRTLPGMNRLTYNFMAPHERRLADVGEALDAVARIDAHRTREPPRPCCTTTDGDLNAEVINRLAGQRDDRRVSLRE